MGKSPPPSLPEPFTSGLHPDASAQPLEPERLVPRAVAEELDEGLALDTLSMGMSHDLEAAIMEGATIVRVGTAIFGERTKAET